MTDSETREHMIRKRCGILVGVSAVAAIGLMFYHPSRADDPLSRPVHGLLILAFLLQLFGVCSIFGMRRGSLFTLGIVLFAFGAGWGMIAATINGFALPQIASFKDVPALPSLLRMTWELNQAFAINGAVLTAAALIFWSIALFRSGQRLLGSSGMAIGVLTGGSLASGLVTMDLHAAILIYNIQLAWLAALGWSVWRNPERSW